MEVLYMVSVACGILSVIFCGIGWIMVSMKSAKAYWASACSLALVSLALLMEYHMVLNWVNKEDWSALMDVVPGMFLLLSVYVTIMLLANAVLICMAKRKL